MSLYDFLKGKFNEILLSILCAFTLSLYLINVGNSLEEVSLIIIAWVFIMVIVYSTQFLRRKKYYDELIEIVDNMKEKYLIGEMIDCPKYSDAIPYYYLMKKANKSMLEKINEVKGERKEYKEYIEQWIHEIKTPIAAVKLISENDKTSTTRNILYELEKIDGFVEQALFYARSENVDKDYFVKEVSAEKSVTSVLMKNKQMFLRNGIKVKLHNLDNTIYSDGKWIEFIIGLVLDNSIKYKNQQEPEIQIYCEDIKNGVCLNIKDNGIGIEEDELSRVFEKGFTGSNGRMSTKSTGIGLYLCKKLCIKLDHEIKISSVKNQYTKVSIFFPKGNFVKFES